MFDSLVTNDDSLDDLGSLDGVLGFPMAVGSNIFKFLSVNGNGSLGSVRPRFDEVTYQMH